MYEQLLLEQTLLFNASSISTEFSLSMQKTKFSGVPFNISLNLLQFEISKFFIFKNSKFWQP